MLPRSYLKNEREWKENKGIINKTTRRVLTVSPPEFTACSANKKSCGVVSCSIDVARPELIALRMPWPLMSIALFIDHVITPFNIDSAQEVRMKPCGSDTQKGTCVRNRFSGRVAAFSDLATELRPSARRHAPWSSPLVPSPPLTEVTGRIKLPPHRENVFASAF